MMMVMAAAMAMAIVKIKTMTSIAATTLGGIMATFMMISCRCIRWG